MLNNMSFKIKNVGPIGDAEIDIGKINIIGGTNSSGKSNASKLLYSFLEVNTFYKKELSDFAMDTYLKKLVQLLNRQVEIINNELNKSNDNIDCDKIFEVPKFEYLSEDNLFLTKYGKEYNLIPKISELSDNFDICFRGRVEEYNKLYEQYNMDSYQNILHYFDKVLEDAKVKIKILKKEYDQYVEKHPECENIGSKSDAEFEYLISKNPILEDIAGGIGYINSIIECENINSLFEEINDFIKDCENDSIYLKPALKALLKMEFDIEGPCDFGSASLSYGSKSIKLDFKNYTIESGDSFDIGNVYYLGTYSIFDDEYYHESVIKRLKEDDIFYEKNRDIKNKVLNDSIEEIIGGYIEDEKFITPNYSCSIRNTASGVKQISLLQCLVNYSSMVNSVLIMDEPEVNLHPEWQVKLAEVLVLIAKELDIVLYVNSHSPMFIEAMDTFIDIYGLTDDVNYYLTVKNEESNKYDFVNIDPYELSIIYDNLGAPYDYLELARLNKNRKQRD